VVPQIVALSVKFSLIDSTYFTARAEEGRVEKEVIETIKRTPGAKFDRIAKRWIFPISSHNLLHVSNESIDR
jgi:hypothetical protein